MTDIFSILESIKDKSKLTLPSNPNDIVLIIDGLNSFIRCFCCVPTHNDNGIHIGGLTGFLQSVGKAIRQFNPTRCVVVFDGVGGSQRRRKLYPDYKANRKNRDDIRLNRTYDFQTIQEERESQKNQLIKSVQYLDLLPVTIMSMDRMEADDVIAYLAVQKLNKNNNQSTIIMSSDKDFIQLVDDRVHIWNPIRKLLLTPENVSDLYKIPAHNYLTYRLLDGDPSDNIKGVKGIGIKTLQKRIPQMFTDERVTVDTLLEYAKDHREEAKIFRDLLDNKKTIELNYKLMQLEDVNISGTSKLKIVELFDAPISIMNTLEFQKMFMTDRLWAAFPNVVSWLKTSFLTLDSFARKTQI